MQLRCVRANFVPGLAEDADTRVTLAVSDTVTRVVCVNERVTLCISSVLCAYLITSLYWDKRNQRVAYLLNNGGYGVLF